MKTQRIAACALVERCGHLHVVLVTGRRHGGWLLPKGRLENELSNRQVAELEAWEEAGVVGAAVGPPTRFHMGDTRPVHAYLVRVSRLARHWPEQAQRQRRLVRLDHVAHMDLPCAWRRCIERLAARA